jgi:hypothetical protein
MCDKAFMKTGWSVTMRVRLARKFPWLLTAKGAVRKYAYAFERAGRGALVRRGLLPRDALCPHIEIYGRKIYSQNDEDGILEYLFSVIEPTQRSFVEIGVGPPWRDGRFATDEPLECNCRLLAERGWHGLLVDGTEYPADMGVTRAFVTAENINALLDEHKVPDDLDLFSLDIDGNDYWVWKALERRPKVVVVEYNSTILPSESKTIAYDPGFDWAARGHTQYYGASLLALKRLGEEKGYTFVYANGVNAFFVRSELVPNRFAFDFDRLYRYRQVHAPLMGDEPWVHVGPPS